MNVQADLKKYFQRCGFGSVFFMAIVSCASGPCHQMKNAELAEQQEAKQKKASEDLAAASGASPLSASPSIAGVAGTVLVSKPDGSLQCGMGAGLKPDEMERQLQGIQVLSREKRSDGLMHIQVCGSPTGMINVYEIPLSSLKDAEARGFRKFEKR